MGQYNILCYGDSNTWGYVPNAAKEPIQRYSRHFRWPGILQELLGNRYHIIEEGLNSRTTNIDYHIPPDRNGRTYLPPCLYSHAPIDLVILALGVNDMKVYFNREAVDICDGLSELIDMIQTSLYGRDLQEAPSILVMTPPTLLPILETFKDENGIAFFQGAVKKASNLVPLYAELAKRKGCEFLNISESIIASEIDGGHLEVDMQKKLAIMAADKIQTISKSLGE